MKRQCVTLLVILAKELVVRFGLVDMFVLRSVLKEWAGPDVILIHSFLPALLPVL